MNLRQYQIDAVKGIQNKFRDGKRKVILCLIVGGGKTICASRMIQLAVQNKKRVLFIAHRAELIIQCRDKLKSFGVDSAIIMSGYKEDRTKYVQIASIQTLSRRSKPKADLVIVDECHNSISQEYLKILRMYESEGSYFIGLTATPFRTNKRQGLNEFYEDFVYPVDPQTLIDLGFIVPTKVYCCARIATEKIKKKKGEFDDRELMVAFDKENVYKNLIKNMATYVANNKFIVFCCNVEHSKKTAEELNKNGFICKHIDGTYSKEERDSIINDFKANKFQGIVNVNILTEGTDIPDVGAIVLNMATTSKIKLIQSVGRGMRAYEGKTHCIVLDMADNIIRMGFPEQKFDISLEAQNTKVKTYISPLKDCPHCGYIMAAQVKFCPECNFEMPIRKTKKEIQEEEFIELDKLKLKVAPYLNLPHTRWNEIPTELLEVFAKEKGFSQPKGWVKHQLVARGLRRKPIKILKYDFPDYFKQCNILEKAYYKEANYGIDAHTWRYIGEDDKNIIFEYRLAVDNSIL